MRFDKPGQGCILVSVNRKPEQSWRKKWLQRVSKAAMVSCSSEVSLNRELRVGSSCPEDAALPHGSASDRRLGRHDLVLIDAGGKWGGLVSDITRVSSMRF